MKARHRRKAGDTNKRDMARFHARLVRLNTLFPLPSPEPGAWWFEFEKGRMMQFDADTGGWREAG